MDWSPLAELAVLSSRLSIPTSFTNPIASPPTTRCYWVLENGLLAGAYPGNANPEKHREPIAALYGAGMRTFVNLMEDKHRKRLFADFPDGARFKPIHVLDIPDDYRFMNSELVNLIRTATEPHIDAMRNN